ncbi:hypothetical protein IFM89_036016 [Coptis chinensis]|uniref:Box C/D snoRNA protein 1 n=1 Tax=Coptis chinensis TaxID=261450 RepID=A0A835M8B6_9MAGN|nr:hypothetical protein IFM89_036016 [Coptis chinensis]
MYFCCLFSSVAIPFVALKTFKISTMEVAETDSTDHNVKQSLLCEECGLNQFKYRCPGCSVRSCSLICVKSHKQHTSCTGKRSRTEFVPLSQFDDNRLISDYNLLEETKRIADSARKTRDELFGRFQHAHFKLPYKLRSLKDAAARQKTHIIFLPSGMSKREKNQTRFNYRKKSILWTIEWQFHSTDVVLIDNGVEENLSLCSVIEKHLEPGPWKNQLKPFSEEQLDSLKFFIRKNAKGSNSPFRELDIKAPISEQLANIVIVEYPVIHVFLPSASYEFDIAEDIEPFPHKSELKELISDDLPSPKGILFREEEAEDDISDPYIMDLMKYINPELAVSSHYTNFKKPSMEELQLANDNIYYGSTNSQELGTAEGNDFVFEQDLRDAFSGLIDEANPDEFLDFGGFVDEGSMDDEELEEGEIPAS